MTPKNTNTLSPKSHVTHSDLRTWRVAKTFLAYSVVCTLSCHVLKGLPRGSSNENLLEIKRYPIISVLASWWIPCTTSSNGPNDTITCTIYGKPILSYLILSYLIFHTSVVFKRFWFLRDHLAKATQDSPAFCTAFRAEPDVPGAGRGTSIQNRKFRTKIRSPWLSALPPDEPSGQSILRHHIAWICKLGLTWKLNTNPWKKRFQHVWTFAPASWEDTTWDLLQLI